MRQIIFCLICLLYLLIILTNFIHLICVKKWINGQKNSKLKNPAKPLYLLIPVLYEQNIIRETYEHFYKVVTHNCNIKVVFISTGKEKKVGQKQTTREILLFLKESAPSDNILILNYPHDNGVMAHQLNYAVHFIKENFERNRDFWIGIYNADSRINEKAIAYVNNVVVRSEGQSECYQQYSWYINPREEKKSILGSASLWQSRWSIAFEFYRAIYQIKVNELYKKARLDSTIIRTIFDKMNYVIGHGLFITESLLARAGGFPEETINEDAYLGYILNQMHVDIKPIPYLECSDFAKSITSYIKQQTVWFNGPLYAFQYMKLWFSKSEYSKKEKHMAFVLAVKLFLHAIYWIGSPLILYIVPVFCIVNIYQLILWCIIILFQMPITHYFVRITLIKIGVPDNLLASPSIFCVVFYFLHCIGPIRGIIMKCVGKNTQKDKYKTER